MNKPIDFKKDYFDLKLPPSKNNAVYIVCEMCGQKYACMKNEIPEACVRCNGILRPVQ